MKRGERLPYCRFVHERTLGEHPGAWSLWAILLELTSAILSVLDPVLQRPGLGLFLRVTRCVSAQEICQKLGTYLLLRLLVLLEGKVTASDGSSAGEQSATNLSQRPLAH